MQLYHDESDELREDEVEDVMGLQADDLQSVSGDSISSDDLEEASDLSDAE